MPWKIITKGSLPKDIADDIASRMNKSVSRATVIKGKSGYHVAVVSPLECIICKKEIKNIGSVVLTGERFAHTTCVMSQRATTRKTRRK